MAIYLEFYAAIFTKKLKTTMKIAKLHCEFCPGATSLDKLATPCLSQPRLPFSFPGHSAIHGFFSPGAGQCTSLCWTPWGSCSISPAPPGPPGWQHSPLAQLSLLLVFCQQNTCCPIIQMRPLNSILLFHKWWFH